MKNIFLVISICSVLASCSESSKEKSELTIQDYKDKIVAYEDSIVSFQKQQKNAPTYLKDSLIGSLLNFYKLFPRDKSAAKCLDKIQMFYSGEGKIQWSMAYADTLIQKFPKYENRALILESQAANYDMFVNPRDTNKVKYYFSMLLTENPSMDKEKRKGIELRLQNLGMTFEEFIDYQGNNLTGK